MNMKNMDKNRMVYISAGVVALVLVMVLIIKTKNDSEVLPEGAENNTEIILPSNKPTSAKKTPTKAQANTSSQTSSNNSSSGPSVPAKITQEEAVEIAQDRYPGEVTSVILDNQNGKDIYIVEINYDADSGPDVRVSVDAYTGEILNATN